MPHLILDYSANLEDRLDMQALCDHMRDAMVETGVFPLGGIRVRAICCHAYTIADGDPAHAYLHMTCRIGHGRDQTTRLKVAEHLAAAAGDFVDGKAATPLALSLDLAELDPVTSLKISNTIHNHMRSKGKA